MEMGLEKMGMVVIGSGGLPPASFEIKRETT